MMMLMLVYVLAMSSLQASRFLPGGVGLFVDDNRAYIKPLNRNLATPELCVVRTSKLISRHRRLVVTDKS